MKKEKIEVKEEVCRECCIKPTLTPKQQMEEQRAYYLDLLKILTNEGIINIGVLENKIARLNEELK